MIFEIHTSAFIRNDIVAVLFAPAADIHGSFRCSDTPIKLIQTILYRLGKGIGNRNAQDRKISQPKKPCRPKTFICSGVLDIIYKTVGPYPKCTMEFTPAYMKRILRIYPCMSDRRKALETFAPIIGITSHNS